MGFVSGAASPCCFHHPDRDISVVVHGDDFTAMGLDADLDYYETELAKNFELKIRGRLGEGCKGDNQIRIVNRIITLTPPGVTYEADPRHVDLLVESMGLSQSNSVSTPGAKDPTPDYDAQKHHEDDSPSGDLSKSDHTLISEMQISKIDAILPHNVQLPHAINFSDQIDVFQCHSVRGNLWHTPEIFSCNLFRFHAHFRSL